VKPEIHSFVLEALFMVAVTPELKLVLESNAKGI